jgi:DNA polymerase I-like protein with 3'-5' exonuclease and polymerase domains
MSLFNSLKEFYSEYEMPLARVFHEIDRRGVLVDQQRLKKFVEGLDISLQESCDKISLNLKCPVVPKGTKGKKLPTGTLNLSSVPGLKKALTDIGIKLKKDWKTKNESTGEEALNEAFATTGNPVLKEILRVRELNKIKGTYANATLLDSILYTSYAVTGTVTGRRSSRETPFTSEGGHKIGTNVQNLPKQSELGKKFRECIIARPGKIFVSCDQVQAEDWVVCGIIADVSGNRDGLNELLKGIDRHKRLAMQIFQKPESECSKGTMFRLMGKKTRHAGNYGMQAPKMAVELAKEGFSLGIKYCETLLGRFHAYEPEIRNSFQSSIESSIRLTRTLRTPVGRERYFFGLRPDADNSKIYKEAFSYLPQSTVGDNTGLSILFCEQKSHGKVIMDTHDAVTLEVNDEEEEILAALELLRDSFDREFTFPKGTKIKIPIEATLGYDLRNEVEIHDFSDSSIYSAIQEVKRKRLLGVDKGENREGIRDGSLQGQKEVSS